MPHLAQYLNPKKALVQNSKFRWCSWLSHSPNTRKVLSSSLGRNIFAYFLTTLSRGLMVSSFCSCRCSIPAASEIARLFSPRRNKKIFFPSLLKCRICRSSVRQVFWRFCRSCSRIRRRRKLWLQCLERIRNCSGY